MRHRTLYAIHYGQHVARFSSYRDAMIYARDKSIALLGPVEVHAKDGIVGQFLHGTSTPEFRQHWQSALEGT